MKVENFKTYPRVDYVNDLVDQLIDDGETPDSALDILLNTLLYIVQAEYTENCIEKLDQLQATLQFAIKTLKDKYQDDIN